MRRRAGAFRKHGSSKVLEAAPRVLDGLQISGWRRISDVGSVTSGQKHRSTH